MKETLEAEKKDLQDKIQNEYSKIEACKTAIYWLNKRLKVTNGQLEAIKPEKDESE